MNPELKIAITGAGGFLGSSALDFFSAHPSIKAINALYSSEASAQSSHEKIQPLVGELSNANLTAELVKDCHLVLHFAHRGYPLDTVENAEINVQRNLEAFGQLLDSMNQFGVKRLLVSGSGGAIYKSDRHQKRAFTEADPIDLRTAYARSKLGIEVLAKEQKNIESYLLRISNPYGIGLMGRKRQGFIGIALEKVLNKEPVEIWGSLSIRKDFIYIEDLLQAFEHCVVGNVPAGTYNVGSGQSRTLGDVIKNIEKATQMRAQLSLRQPKQMDIAWTALDCSAFKRTAGWSCQYSLEEGIQNLVKQLQGPRPTQRPSPLHP